MSRSTNRAMAVCEFLEANGVNREYVDYKVGCVFRFLLAQHQFPQPACACVFVCQTG